MCSRGGYPVGRESRLMGTALRKKVWIKCQSREAPKRQGISRSSMLFSHNKRVLIALAFSFAFLLPCPLLPPLSFSLLLFLSSFTISRSNKLTVYRLGGISRVFEILGFGGIFRVICFLKDSIRTFQSFLYFYISILYER